MCDVCKAEGIDWNFSNGKKTKLNKAKLYRVYVGRTATVQLCHLHDIQLFVLGEQRFLKEHIALASNMFDKRSEFA